SARSVGSSWKASHTQKGMSGVSSVAIREAWPDGNRREPSTKREAEHRKHRQIATRDVRKTLRKGNADDAAEKIRQRGRGDHRVLLVTPNRNHHRRDGDRHDAGEPNASKI